MGRVVGARYELASPIGGGSYGSVWAGWDTRAREWVAVKLLKDPSEEALHRFLREQRLRLDHAHLLAPLDMGFEGDLPYIVLPLVRGGTLAQHLAEDGPLSQAEAEALVAQVSDALDHIHGLGVVHRDVQPSNIVLDHTPADGGLFHAYLIDFGCALKLDSSRLSSNVFVPGTPGYRGPEVCAGAEATDSADVYALAVTAYEAFTGVRICHRSDPTPPVAALVFDSPFDLDLDRLPSSLRRFVAANLDPRPEQRAFDLAPPSVEVRTFVPVRVETGDPPNPVRGAAALGRRGGREPGSGRRRWWLGAAAVAVAFAMALGVLVWPDASEAPDAAVVYANTQQLHVTGLGDRPSEQLTFPESGNSFRPRWSPDGTRIAFVRELGDRRTIAVVDADGSNEVLIPGVHPQVNGLDWSPDGDWLVFGNPTQLSRIRSTAPFGKPLPLLDAAGQPLLVEGAPAWAGSPGGGLIAFYTAFPEFAAASASDDPAIAVYDIASRRVTKSSLQFVSNYWASEPEKADPTAPDAIDEWYRPMVKKFLATAGPSWAPNGWLAYTELGPDPNPLDSVMRPFHVELQPDPRHLDTVPPIALQAGTTVLEAAQPAFVDPDVIVYAVNAGAQGWTMYQADLRWTPSSVTVEGEPRRLVQGYNPDVHAPGDR